MGEPTVWIVEDQAADAEGWMLLEGTFTAHALGVRDEEPLSGVGFSEAAAWSLLRVSSARQVDVSWDDGQSETLQDLQEAGRVAELDALQRRRPTRDRWLDRTPDDPPIMWEVAVAMFPPDGAADYAEQHRSWRSTAATLAKAVDAELDTSIIRALQATLRRMTARGHTSFGMSVTTQDRASALLRPPLTAAYFLRRTIVAPDRTTATRAVEQLIPTGLVPQGWVTSVHVAPADPARPPVCWKV